MVTTLLGSIHSHDNVPHVCMMIPFSGPSLFLRFALVFARQCLFIHQRQWSVCLFCTFLVTHRCRKWTLGPFISSLSHLIFLLRLPLPLPFTFTFTLHSNCYLVLLTSLVHTPLRLAGYMPPPRLSPPHVKIPFYCASEHRYPSHDSLVNVVHPPLCMSILT